MSYVRIENRARFNLWTQLRRLLFPEKCKTRPVISVALSRQRLPRPTCEVCGAKAEAHHPPYAEPLSIVWLCPAHHRALHRSVKEWKVLRSRYWLLADARRSVLAFL